MVMVIGYTNGLERGAKRGKKRNEKTMRNDYGMGSPGEVCQWDWSRDVKGQGSHVKYQG
jgi:hypothetical protein